jgi:sulfoquinovosidase
MDVKRRELLTLAATAVAAAAIEQRASAQTPAPLAADNQYPVGEFILQRAGKALRVVHQRNPNRVLWESAADGNFIIAEDAAADIRAFGTPEGAYTIRDKVSAAYEQASIDAIDVAADRATVTGQLRGKGGAIGYRLSFEAVSPAHLRFEIKAESQPSLNRIRLRSASVADEGFFGFGEQLTYFNQKGNVLPILVQEHGVGRGRPVVTQVIDVFANGGGRNPYVTEAPAPHFISSRLRSLFLENTEYSVFDMRQAEAFEIKVWSGTMTGQILYGETPLDLIEAYTAYAGRMRVLPDWVHSGVIAGLMGGTQSVRKKLATMRQAGVPLAGLWLQDWVGVRITSAGTQLWWNWQLDENYYPQWRELVADLESSGARMMIYINPFLSNAKGHDTLFREAEARGYLVKKADGAPYLIKNTDFSAALIDLTNPQTRTWIKGVIKSELIGKAGASGWMADFGEALPFDSKLEGDASPGVWHNRYSVEWAKVHREAIEEAGRGEDIVFFNRSGFTQSPKFSTLFWLGDQMETWDEYDGIKTAVAGLLSGGVSGFSLLHSDTGGYVTLSINAGGRKIPVVARSDELFQRWMELNAFTSVFRTHEGLDPTIGAQIDSSPANTAQLARFAKVYKALAPYRKRLVAAAAARGYPVVRHLFLHYPDDPNTYSLRYQFLLGPDVMVAPVLDPGVDALDVYFPAGSEWTDLWTGTDAGKPGAFSRMPAPLSRPAIFLRKGAASADEICAGLQSAGVL